MNKIMNTPNMDTTGVYCVSEVISETEEDAWNQFIIKYEHICRWYRGTKFWRVKPYIECRADFDTLKKKYRVYARMVLVLRDIDSQNMLEEANFEYHGKKYTWRQKRERRNMNIPRWVWFIIWVAIVLIVLVLLKVNINVGSGGFSVSQGLVH